MTREEAISLLHDMKDTYDEIHENTNYEIGYEQMTAIDMAIEALSAEPSLKAIKKQIDEHWYLDKSDLISRADAIEAVQSLYYTDRKIVLEALKALPSADRPQGENISENGFLCSVCGFGDFGGFHGYEPNYCPNCGAYMGGTHD